MTNLGPAWGPKRLQNRGSNPKKSKLKNSTFSTSIFLRFGPRFGRVFGWFVGREVRAARQKLKYVESQQNISWAHEI